MALYDVPAPAKLNLFLHVVGRRPDGYHLLQTVFRFVDLCDSLDFDLSHDGRVVCENVGLTIEPQQDLVVRAAHALRKATGTRLGARIACRKRIPMGGGLGGGSSDAATTLVALNRLWQTNLSRSQLRQLASTLGADVPVFVFGQSAFAQGIGDQLDAVALPERAYVIAQPFDHVPTAAIFSAPELTRDSECITMSVFTNWQENSNTASNTACGNAGFGRNDLQAVVCNRFGRVGKMASWFEACGYHARMTGSGACFFVEFVTVEQARVCLGKITAKMPDDKGVSVPVIKNSWVCNGLPDHPLRHWIRS
jgi:4-diphosphocytidyl-2-C-methyl-D-erythritol kinase